MNDKKNEIRAVNDDAKGIPPFQSAADHRRSMGALDE